MAVCDIVSVKNAFRYLTNLAYADLSGTKLVVASMNALSTLNNVLLNLAMNQIEMVDLDSVKSLTEKSKIYLSDNPLACNCSNIQ